MPDWDWFIATTKGERLLRLDNPTERKLSFVLGDANTAEFGLSGRDPQAAAVRPFQTDLMIYRDGALLYRGRVGETSDEGDANTHTLKVPTTDYRGWITERRIVYGEGATPGEPTAHGKWIFEGLTQSDVAWRLVSPDQLPGTQIGPGGDLGIRRGSDTAPPTVRRIEVEAGTKVGEAIQNIAFIFGGFEWWIDPTLHFHTGWRGQERPTPLEYGSTVRTFSRTLNAGEYANAIRVSGGEPSKPERPQGSAPAPQGHEFRQPPAPVALRWVEDIESRPEGRMAVQIGLTDLKMDATTDGPDAAVRPEHQALVDDAAVAELAARGTIVPTYKLGLVHGVWTPTSLEVGDNVQFKIASGYLNVDDRDRIQQIDVDVDASGNETVEVTLGTLRAGIMRLLKKTPERLERLERR